MPDIRTDTVGSNRIIRYANPPRHYMTAEGAERFAAEISSAADDPSIRTIILTGTDDVFVRHYDVSEIVAAGEAVLADRIDATAFETGPFVSLLSACQTAPKPVIAAINGVCMGGGFELALACDLRIIAESVEQIGLPETRIGIFPGGGGTQRLARTIGPAGAMNFILRGQVVDAASALELGLVHECAGDAVERSIEIGSELAQKDPVALSTAKRLIQLSMETPLSEGLVAEQHAFFNVLSSGSAVDIMKNWLKGDQDITR